MAKNRLLIDSVRASRDGHEFHEAWTARKALQLLFPTDHLVGIAVEGLHPDDQNRASSATVQIADSVLYYGKFPTFEIADAVHIVQFKYSLANSTTYFRCSDAKKTIKKFAASYRDHNKKYGQEPVKQKLLFELITNQPVYPPLEQAIVSIAQKRPMTDSTKKQGDQFKKACGLKSAEIIEFASKLRIVGLAGSLSNTKREVSRIVVDWSAACDIVAKARLGGMQQLVRSKAGSAGAGRNIIRITDVLDALHIQDEKDLLPCPTNFPKIGPIVVRRQLDEAIERVSVLDKPLLVHAAGGIGKTVFLTSLAKAISNNHEVIMFDCFGGGSYRDPEDSRHLPKRGLVHITNTLACRGLCDPLLPGGESPDDLIRAFLRRLRQAIETLRRASPDKELILIIDAVDNAAEHAMDINEPCFPKLLLESFHNGGKIPGVKLIASCRTHRIAISKGDVECIEFQLEPFSPDETRVYLSERLKKLTEVEIQVAQARSGGNPRILEHLVYGDRSLLEKSEINNTIELDDLLKGRIEKALSVARSRGYKQSDMDTFLAGLSVLPPPVPIDEYAKAHNMDTSAVESFAADLSPLLERTKYGLMFRDEPTETLIQKAYGNNPDALRRVARNLTEKQDTSVYAARALPSLLQRLNEGEHLFKLAFDQRFPSCITSTVGRQNIRYDRLKASALYEAHKANANHLVHLLLELSTVAAANRRGADFIVDNPDLVISAKDIDATRRLFETRTPWPGTRHARLAIAHALSGDQDETYRHAARAYEWIFHYYRQRDQENRINHPGPEHLDIASIPFSYVTQNRLENAIDFMRGWKSWYAYEVGECLVSLIQQVRMSGQQSKSRIQEFINALKTDIGITASLLSFFEALDNSQKEQLIKKISKACQKEQPPEFGDRFQRRKRSTLLDGLLKASAIAASLNLPSEGLGILNSAAVECPGIWSFRDHSSDYHVLPFLTRLALVSALNKREVEAKDVLPRELVPLSAHIKDGDDVSEFKKDLLKNIDKAAKNQDEETSKTFTYEGRQEAERYINQQLEPVLALTKALSDTLGSSVSKGDKPFLSLLRIWAEVRNRRDPYSSTDWKNLFFQVVGRQMAVFALWARNDLKITSVKSFIEHLHGQKMIGPEVLIEVVSILAKRNGSQTLAGEEAVKAKSLIEQEDEVTHRGSLFSMLARAILPASKEEAAAYFKMGLEQMDAIGSGDYEFTNELLLFASSIKGEELSEQDFQALTNICELNMYEAEKFPWFAFGLAMSKTSGCRGLAKLGRWDDRTKISLNYTLLPYLTALIQDGKIAPEDALALLRLSDPAELYSCGTGTFANAIDARNFENFKELILELVEQFQKNNPGVSMGSTIETLASLTEKTLGNNSEIVSYLSDAQQRFSHVTHENNENINYHGKTDARLLVKTKKTDRENLTKIKRLAATTKPNDEISVADAVETLNNMSRIFELKNAFFDKIRDKIAFADRSKYINIIARLKNLNVYIKLAELTKCKQEWSQSSAAVEDAFSTIAIPIIQLHVGDLIGFGQLSGYKLKEISDLCGRSMLELAMELVKTFASPDWHVSASVWLGLASIISEGSDAGQSQAALSRLLNSESAKLASGVTDGGWKTGLYPSNNAVEIVSGLIWRVLGSPDAAARWRAAHSVRCLSRFARWDIIDALVARTESDNARPFQAPELPFYYLHARLWLLIALARVAKEEPKRIAQYQKTLSKIVFDTKSTHALMRHFAAETIRVCAQAGAIKLSAKQRGKINSVNASPFPRMEKRLKEGQRNSFYAGRPKEAPAQQEPRFYFDYDFEKHDIENLSEVFGKPHWEVTDLITEAVRKYDDNITSMHDNAGRETPYRHSSGMTSDYHSYGQYLGWHAVLLTAGQMLSRYPVTKDSYREEPWTEWLSKYQLTRSDGLWLSDGIDRPPLSTKVNLLEKGDKDLVITGDKAKILSLIEVDSKTVEEIVVAGDWNSPDNIDVHIRSALVPSNRSDALAKSLIKEEPFFVWLPAYEDYDCEEEYSRRDKKEYRPWIITFSSSGRLDEHDPLGTICSIRRLRFTKEIISTLKLHSEDPFVKIWKGPTGKEMAHSDAWGCDKRPEDENSYSGIRLVCSCELLRKVLAKNSADLLILVRLQRYQKEIRDWEGTFSHTIAVIRISKTLEFKFYEGAINKQHPKNNR